MKRTLSIIISAIMLVSALAGCSADEFRSAINSSNSTNKVTSAQNTATTTAAENTTLANPEDYTTLKRDESRQHAVIKVKNYGDIVVELDDDNAPKTVANFVKLIEEKFYDGLTFHRVMQNFMIQGGDPLGNGTGGSDETIKGEFSENGVENNLSHKRGVISMARSNDNDSASSQFFICDTDDSASLDGKYAAFGWVVSGMDVVDSIAANTPVTDNNGTVESSNQPVIVSIRMND